MEARSPTRARNEEVAALNPVGTTERGSEAPPPATPPGELDEPLLAEGRRLLDRACTGGNRDRGQAAVMTDELLDRARRAAHEHTLSPPYFARVLRAAALVRNMARLPELPPDTLVHELVAHTVQHGLAAHNAAAQALRGSLAVSRGSIDDALDAVVDAMVTLELVEEPSVERALAINDTGSLLDQLGLPEVAAEMFERSAGVFGELGMTAYQIMTIGDQVRAELLYGMWLERVSQSVAGAERFTVAAELASAGIRMWERSSPLVELDEEFLAVFHAAFALADPSGSHEQALRKATPRIALPGQMMASLALVRLLAADGRRDEADTTLSELRAECRRFQLGLPLRLALARGVLDLNSAGTDAADIGVLGYLAELEDEMWGVHGTRAKALHARLEFERLRRGRQAMRMLTAKDPVTRLPDRSVLDSLMNSPPDPTHLPAALAMVDIDHLMRINQRGSQADGDAALRAVAVTVSGAMRPEDSVLRYDDDEFVVVMPNRTLEDAAETMRRVATAVTTLPYDRGRGATVSIGVVSVGADEFGESALIRADEATSEAKAHGGNQVVAAPSTPAPRT
jgi:diguanylate cyclase (GGDEF)-like protein